MASLPAPASTSCVPAWTAIQTPGRIHTGLKETGTPPSPVLFSPGHQEAQSKTFSFVTVLSLGFRSNTLLLFVA